MPIETSMSVARFLSFFGTASAIFGFGWVHATQIDPTTYDPIGTSVFPWTVLFVAGVLAGLYAMGLPELATSRRSVIGSTVLALAGSIVFVSLFQLLLGTPLLPRSVVGVGGFLVLPVQLLAWNVADDRQRLAAAKEQVVLLAEPDGASDLVTDLTGQVERPATIAVHLTPDEVDGSFVDDDVVLRSIEDAGASVLILDVAAQAVPRIVRQAAAAHEAGIRIRTLSLFTEEYLGKLPVTELERVSLLFDIGELHRARYNRLKRLVDIMFAVLLLVPLAMVVPVVIAGNVLSNRGPLLFRQDRIGKGGQPFEIFKFRSMLPYDGPSTWTQVEDSRVTTFGRFMRRTHLDELPQVVNILRGDLSLVGPRPEQANYVDELREKIPFYDVRHLVRPGLTGWAQVKYQYGATEQDAVEKLQYEFYYLRHQSLMLDARIIARTARAVVGQQGR